jgi:hypothetical protein
MYCNNTTENNDLWTKADQPGQISMNLVSTPYRFGVHYASRPRSFLPIIDTLYRLHENNFVHGDIRGFNTVFEKFEHQVEKPEGWLIDFDFGGGFETTLYSAGYRSELVDGDRVHVEAKGTTKIEQWHDWYALGRLIFQIHGFSKPETNANDLCVRRCYDLNKMLRYLSERFIMGRFCEMNDMWRYLPERFKKKEVFDLKTFHKAYIAPLIKLLEDLDRWDWIVKRAPKFSGMLKQIGQIDNSDGQTGRVDGGSISVGTGSPLKY